MTRYSDNIYSGFQAPTSANSSMSPVVLRKTHRFTQPSTGGANAVTQLGTFPPGAQNLRASLYIANAATSASVSDKITVSAGGVNYYAFTGIGSAQGILGATTAGLGTVTATVSAVINLAPPATNQTNGGEIPYAVTFLPVSASKSTDYQLELTFNRAVSNTLGTSQ